MKQLLVGLGVACATVGGATYLILTADPVASNDTPRNVATVPSTAELGCGCAIEGSCSGGVVDVVDLEVAYRPNPAPESPIVLFEEPPLAPKREKK